MFKWFHGSPHVVEFVGSCDYHTIVTKYYSLGSLRDVIPSLRIKAKIGDTLQLRFILVVNYLRMLEWFHTHEPGPFVLCCSSNIKRYMHHFLVGVDLRIVLNTPDILQLADPATRYVCKSSTSKLAAPEEHGAVRARVTEKRDIWRIPFVVEYIFGEDGYEAMMPYFSEINAKCQTTNPFKRPTATQVLHDYLKVARILDIKKTSIGKMVNF